jgi:hypothetical protein
MAKKSSKPAPKRLLQPLKRPQPPVRPLTDTSDLVLTPGGLRPRSLVHKLQPGEHVSLKGGRVRIIKTATGEVVKDLGESAKPGESEKSASKKRPATPNLRPTPGIPDVGWIENSQWRNGGTQPIVYFSTTWIVPPVPSSTDDGQTIFLFNGMQPDSGAHILQPVLQWGPSGAGGGNYWSITNWYADGKGGPAAYQTPIQVNPGDVVQGVMTCTGQSGTEFNYQSSFVGFPSLDTVATDADELTWAYQTLECYSGSYAPLVQCSDYPATPLTAMYNIEIKTGTPGTSGTDAVIDWSPITAFTDCGQNCLIVSNDSPGGAVYLYYKQPPQNFYFIIDKGTFGKDEVTDTINSGGGKGLFPAAIFLAVEGFTVQQLTIDLPNMVAPQISGAFAGLHGVTVTPSVMYPPVYDSSNLYTPQRVLFPYDIQFTDDSIFPTSGLAPEELDAKIVIGSASLGTETTLNATTILYLGSGAAPYFTNVDPAEDNVYYLSQDLRVFTITPESDNATPVGNVPFIFQNGSPTSLDTPAAYAYISALIAHFNTTYSDPNGIDPFNISSGVLPGEASAYSGDSTVTPATFNPTDIFAPYLNYNFALARVRLKGTAGSAGEASNVRVFFRLFTTQTFDTDYINTASAVSAGDPNITYPSNPPGSPNAPTSPLPGTNASGVINGSTLPFFAAADQSDLAAGGVNNRLIKIPTTSDSTWAYFGCFLNVYDPSLLIGGSDPQKWLVGSAHSCLVAQIAYSDTPIENTDGVIENPENSSLLAQRNLQITLSGNPGYPETHFIPQTFDTRPSPTPGSGSLAEYPDELMIDWRNTPPGTTAEIYWPQVNASQVLALASALYPASTLSAADPHTIRCNVDGGMTYIPVPSGGMESFAGLITLQLPPGIHVGNEFNVIIRRITSRRVTELVIASSTASSPVPSTSPATSVNWRYVVGTFQIKIPVQPDATILPSEENLLAILRWRLQRLDPTNRWYPVLQRYISVVVGRVRGCGGKPGTIVPSQYGTANQPKQEGKQQQSTNEKCVEWTGKVSALRYDRFGDFIGFDLETLSKELRRFRGREQEIEDLVRGAWVERNLIRVVGSESDAEWPAEIILLRPKKIRL